MSLFERDVHLAPENLEPDGALRVRLQDNPAELVNVRLCNILQNVTLASNTAIGDEAITLVAGHGTVAGNIICLKQNGRFYQAVVLSVATDTINLDTPLDYAFTVAATAHRSTGQLAVDGSSSAVTYKVSPPAGTKWDIYGFSLNLMDGDQMDDGKFGGITALTKGVVVRKKDGTYKNIFTVKTNGDLAIQLGNIDYSSKAPSGTYGLTATTYFQERYGVAMRLDAELEDELQIIVRDNLSGLSSFTGFIWGHVVS